MRGRRPGPHAPWHFLYFLPEPHQHGSLRPIFSWSDLTTVTGFSPVPSAAPLPPCATSSALEDVVTTAPPAAAAAASAEGCSGPPPEYETAGWAGAGSGSKSVGSTVTSTWKMTRANSSQIEFMRSRNI